MIAKQTITIKVKPIYEIGKGHNPHRGGAGVMGDRRTRRARTRGTQNRNAFNEYK